MRIRLSLVLALACSAALAAPFSVDMRGVVSQQDIVYRAPARQGWEGLPLGNGTLGAMAWQPDGLKFQLNTPLGGVYHGAVCQVAVRPAVSMLSGLQTYRQRLSLYDATVTTECVTDTGTVTATSFIPATDDALIVELTDNRTGGKECAFDLDTWRKSTARSTEGGLLLITDTLKLRSEPDYKFAVAAAVEGTPLGEPSVGTATLTQRAEGKRLVLWVAVADSRDPEADVLAQAKAKLAALRARGLDAIRKANADWWAQCWAKSYLKVTSDDAVGDYLTNLWYMHIYAMAAGSRGEVPPKFNGGLWLFNRDDREWGAGFWHWNTQETYWPLYAANHLELLAPYYDMYQAMLPRVKEQTKNYFGVDGAHYEETIAFNGGWASGKGPKVLRDHPRLPTPDKIGVTAMILSSSAEIAMQYWWNYLYTGDLAFLRDRAYPLMKEVTAFYVAYLEKGADGLYHMYPSNAHETYWAKKDPVNDIAGLRYLFPAIIAASAKLGVDPDLRAVWQERLKNLTPYPTNPQTGAITPYALLPGEKLEKSNAENPDLFAIAVFPNITLNSPDLKRGIATFHARQFVNTYGWTTDSIAAARLGLAEAGDPNGRPHERGLEYLLPLHAEYYQDHPNGLQDYYNRKPAIHCYLEGSGTFATGMNEMLLQSFDGIIRVCPALPKAWSADFKLLAMGGFEVTAHAEKGTVTALTLLSRRGENACVANPFGGMAAVTCDGKGVLKSDKPLLTFPTKAGMTYLLLPAGAPAPAYKVTGTRNDEPKHMAPNSKRWLGILADEVKRWTPPAEMNAPQPPAVPAAIERSTTPTATAARLTAAPAIDGDLADPGWGAVKPLGPYFLLGKRAPATQQTEVRIGHDRQTLYVGMTCWEVRMSGMVADIVPKALNPADIFQDDTVELFIQPVPGTIWHLAVNGLGAQYTALGSGTADETPLALEWRAAVRRLSNRWIVEMAIPLAGLYPSLPSPDAPWRFNVCRNERPFGETSSWAPLSKTAFHLPAEFGSLQLSDMPPAVAEAIPDPTLVGHWTFDALNGPWAADASGHRHVGMLIGPAKLVDGRIGKALELTGAGYVNIQPEAGLDVTMTFTLTAWVNPKVKGSMRLIDKGAAGSNDAYLVDTHPANNLRVITRAGGFNLTETLPVGQWTHVAVTFGAGKVRAYLNGKLITEQNAGPATNTTALPLRLGADSGGGSRFVGLLDDVRIYNRTLSAEDVSALAAEK
ncbi:MAG: LamG-like jellyroll fold domain-containing protein [Armatimonadota bacterium]